MAENPDNHPTPADYAAADQAKRDTVIDMQCALLENMGHGLAILLSREGDRTSIDAANVIVRSVSVLRVARGIVPDPTTRVKY